MNYNLEVALENWSMSESVLKMSMNILNLANKTLKLLVVLYNILCR